MTRRGRFRKPPGRPGRRPARSGPRRFLGALLLGAVLAAGACAGDDGRPPATVEVEVPEGAGTMEVARRLEGAGLVRWPRLFTAYVALRGAEGDLKAGRYGFPDDVGWGRLVTALERGEVQTVAVTVPEGFTLRSIAPRLATVTDVPSDSVLALARDSGLVASLGVPGPTLEGYLFPDTYRFADGVSPRVALRAMVRRYREFWTPERRALADSLGLSEREVVTLASIVEAEARVAEERPVIAGVYLNRLETGMRLQADPTVQYVLGARKARLLYRDIDSVADDPYNTYTHAGLPPGPIGSPGEASLQAVLQPADVPYLFFVARPDGSHVFTRTQEEHVEAKNRIRGR